MAMMLMVSANPPVAWVRCLPPAGSLRCYRTLNAPSSEVKRCASTRSGPSARARLGLDRERRRPKRVDVHAQRMQLQHLVVELAGCLSRFGEPVEVSDVLPSLLDNSRAVFVPRPLVSRDHGTRLQSLDCVEGGNPLASLLRVGFGQQLVNAVVRGVSGDDQSEGWHMQDGRVVRVRMPDLEHDQI